MLLWSTWEKKVGLLSGERRNKVKLENIGFYTLEDERAKNASNSSPLWRCELLLTDKCNFRCPYCRGMRSDLKGTITEEWGKFIIDKWAEDNLQNIRFSGGEPTLFKPLLSLVEYAKLNKIKRIAISTNGSADLSYYKELIDAGVNDFSISLDSCCSSFGFTMNGGIPEAWEKTISNIQALSELTYVTVGMVFNELNVDQSLESILFADSLGVSDIRIISSAQFNQALQNLDSIPQEVLDRHPILKYRVNNFRKGRNVRGLKDSDCKKCYLVLDDMAVAKDYHFPCIIYLREMGNPVGNINGNIRQERLNWMLNHNTHKDVICKNNCLDVCIDYNNTVDKYFGGE